MTADSKDFFPKRIPSAKNTRKNKGNAMARRKWSQDEGAERMPEDAGDGTLDAYIDYQLRCLEPRTGRREEEEEDVIPGVPNLIPFGRRANPSAIQASFLEPSWRR